MFSRRTTIPLFLALLLLVGCFAPATSADQTIRLAVWKYGMAGQEEYYRDLAREFEKAYPGRHVRIELGDWAQAHGRLKRWIVQRDGPDLAIIPDVWLAEFAPALERYADQLSPQFLSRFQSVMLERSRYGGSVLGLVWAASTKALFYRTDLFQEAGLTPPTTWEELLAAAQKLNQPPNRCGLAMPGAQALDTADNFYFFLWSNGGQLFGKDGRVGIDSPEALEALNFYRDLAVRHKVTQPNLLSCDKQCAEDIFARGEAAMIETGPWAIRAFASAPASPPFAVVPLPKRKEQITQLVTDHLVLFRNSQRKIAALDFVRFAYQRDWRMRWARMGMIPELKEVADDPFFTRDPAWRVFISELPRSRWIPLMRWEPIDRAITHMLAQVASGQAEPAVALRELSHRLEALAKKYEQRNETRNELGPRP